MSHHEHQPEESSANRSSLSSGRFKWVLLGFVIIAGFLLITEHRAHAFGILLYALPLGCVFMHLFGHGHGGHGGHEGHETRNRERSSS